MITILNNLTNRILINNIVLKNVLIDLFLKVYPVEENDLNILKKNGFFENSLTYYILLKNKKNNIEKIVNPYLETAEFKLKKNFFFNDSIGNIYYPNHGYITSEGKFNKLKNIPQTKIHFIEFIPPILYELNSKINYSPQELINLNKKNINQAFKFLRLYIPLFHKLLKLTSTGICLFKDLELESFAGMDYHGTGFINLKKDKETIVFFIDEISHQFGHVIINNLLINKNEFFNYPFNTLYKDLDSLSNDHRNIFDLMHGFFTLFFIINSLDIYIPKCSKKSNNYFEAIARIIFYLNKMNKDIEKFKNFNILNNKGLFFLNKMISFNFKKNKKYKKHLTVLKFDNQPYVFDYELFTILNKNLFYEN